MRLTRFTDYALRLLIHLAERPDERCTVADIAHRHDISEHHLGKVAHALAGHGFIIAARGRHGGLRLARDPSDISVGEVVRKLEPSETLADCANCAIVRTCRLPGPLDAAMEAFLRHLDGITLADSTKQLASRALAVA